MNPWWTWAAVIYGTIALRSAKHEITPLATGTFEGVVSLIAFSSSGALLDKCDDMW